MNAKIVMYSSPDIIVQFVNFSTIKKANKFIIVMDVNYAGMKKEVFLMILELEIKKIIIIVTLVVIV